MPVTPSLSDRFLVFYFRTGFRGFHFIYKVWVKLGGNPNIQFKSRYGAVYDLYPYGYIEGFVLSYGFYESEVFEALRPFLGPGAVFWDVGSNIGLHAIAAKAISPETTVCAFEPVPELLACIHNNARLNDTAVATFPVALAATTAQRVLYLPRGGNSGRGSLYPLHDIPDTATLHVTCIRADELIRMGSAPAPTVIKLDVEGAEAEVIEGMGDYLEQSRLQAIVFEGHPGLVAEPLRDPFAVRLSRAGFQLQQLERREPTHHALENYLACRV